MIAENGALLYRPANQEEKVRGHPPSPLFIRTLRKRGITPLSLGRVIVSTRHPHEIAVLEVIRDLGLELEVRETDQRRRSMPATQAATMEAQGTERAQSGEWINVGTAERWGSTIGVGALFVYGLTRGSLGGVMLALTGGALLYRGIGGHCYAYQAVGINIAERGRRPLVSVPYNQGIRVEKTVTIAKSPEALYRFWRNFENLPRFTENLVSVTPRSNKVSHWVAKAPAGTTVEWDAEIINDQENQWIAWRSLPNADVDHAGSVRFRPAPGGRGTDSRSTWGKGSLGRALQGFPSYTPRIATIVSPLGLTFTRNNMDSILLYYQKTSTWTKA